MRNHNSFLILSFWAKFCVWDMKILLWSIEQKTPKNLAQLRKILSKKAKLSTKKRLWVWNFSTFPTIVCANYWLMDIYLTKSWKLWTWVTLGTLSKHHISGRNKFASRRRSRRRFWEMCKHPGDVWPRKLKLPGEVFREKRKLPGEEFWGKCKLPGEVLGEV